MNLIECRVYKMQVYDQELPPDVEIKWADGHYVQMKMSNGVRGQGLQTNDNKYAEKMELCRKISDALFELQELIEKEKEDGREFEDN